MEDPTVRAAKECVELIADPTLMDPAAPRSGRVEVTLRDGSVVSHFTRHAPGTMENPMDTVSVNAKARLLMEPVLGAERTEGVIQQVNALEELDDVRELRQFLALEVLE
jgi:2-methylcitrate dehydratase PrpD